MLQKKYTVYPERKGPVSALINRIINRMDDKSLSGSDCVVLLLDNCTVEQLEREYYSFFGKNIIAIVLELDYKTVALLKIADFIFYLDERQKKVAETVMGYSLASEILPLPVSAEQATVGDSRRLICCAESVLPLDLLQKKLGEAGKTGTIIDKYTFAELGVESLFQERIISCKYPPDTACCFFLDEKKEAELSALINGGNPEAIYFPQRGNVLPFLFQAASAGCIDDNSSGIQAPDEEEFGRRVIRRLKEVVALSKTGPEIDDYTDINVVAGSKLQNKFVFSVCFRNQAGKIIRCLESICRQSPACDFGIALVDDASDDDSLARAELFLKQYSIDYILVRNKERKFASRNFYNVIHHMVDNDQSYIIEVDGDDYLASPDVLKVLEASTQGRIDKTMGNLLVDTGAGLKSGMFERERMAVNFFRARNLSECAGWYHLRMTRRGILKQVEIEHFLERDGFSWLSFNHDIVVHSRAMELCRGRIKVIEEELYVYDISGDTHDISELIDDFEHEEWSYGTFFLDNKYLFQIFVPLFEEPQKIPSAVFGEGLISNPYFACPEEGGMEEQQHGA